MAKPRCVLDAIQLAGIAGGLLCLGYFLAGELQGIFTYNNNKNNIYTGSPTRQGGFQWGPRALI